MKRIKASFFVKILIILLIIFSYLYSFPLISSEDKRETIVVFEVSKLPPSFSFYKELKEKEGFRVFVLKSESLNSEDLAFSLREFLKENFETMNIKYLLIVGSDHVFPMKRFTPRGDNIHDQFDSDLVDTPTDIYFVDPFEDFDKDRDGKLGEYPDDNIDIDPLIYVGRIPLDSEVSLENYFSKLVDYEKLPFNRKNYALLIGAYLSFKGETWYDRNLETEDGADFMELLINDFLIKNGITPIRMYETQGSLPSSYISDFPITNSIISSLLSNNAFGLINISAHGNPYHVARMVWNDSNGDYKFSEEESKTYYLLSISDIPENLKGGVLYASSCLTSYPESDISLCKDFLSKGGSAYIGATRVSWGPTYWKGPEDGGLLTINYLFVKNYVDLKKSVGASFWDSISEFQKGYFKNDREDPIEASQMNMFSLNLFGDPTIKFFLEDDSFALFSYRYSEISLKNDKIYLKFNIKKGSLYNKEINFENYETKNSGFIQNIKENEQLFRIDEFNFERYVRVVDEKEISYLLKKENSDLVTLHYFGKEKDLLLRFSDNLEPIDANYFDDYRDVAIFKVKDKDLIKFKKLDKNSYFIYSNDLKNIILKDKKFDYNDDFFVNKIDFYIFSKNFGNSKNDSYYSEIFDIILDGKIDGLDLIYLCKKFGDIVE